MFRSIQEYLVSLRSGEKKSVILTALFIAALALSMVYSPWSDKAEDVCCGFQYVFFGISEIFEIISHIMHQLKTGKMVHVALVFYIAIFAAFPYIRYALRKKWNIKKPILCFMAENIVGYPLCLLAYFVGDWMSEVVSSGEAGIALLIIPLLFFGVLYYFTLLIAAIKLFHFSLYLWWAILLKVGIKHLPDVLTGSLFGEGTLAFIEVIMILATIVMMLFIENVIMKKIDALVFDSEEGPFKLSLRLFEPLENRTLTILFILILVDVTMAFAAAVHVGLLPRLW